MWVFTVVCVHVYMFCLFFILFQSLMLKTVQQTLSCVTEMLFVKLWRVPTSASAIPDTLETEKYALVIIIRTK